MSACPRGSVCRPGRRRCRVGAISCPALALGGESRSGRRALSVQLRGDWCERARRTERQSDHHGWQRRGQRKRRKRRRQRQEGRSAPADQAARTAGGPPPTARQAKRSGLRLRLGGRPPRLCRAATSPLAPTAADTAMDRGLPGDGCSRRRIIDPGHHPLCVVRLRA